MKWNYIKDGVLPKDCELVVGISCWRNEEYVYSLEYRSVTRSFIVKSTERDCKEFLREDQVKAWCSFSEIYSDFEDRDRLRNSLSASQKEVYHPVYGCSMIDE